MVRTETPAWFAFTSSKTRWTSCRQGARRVAGTVCKDVTLHFELAVLAAQAGEFFALSAAQHVLVARGFAAVGGGLRDPSRDAFRGDPELTRKLRGLAPGSHQLDHLSAELCRIRGLRVGMSDSFFREDEVSTKLGQRSSNTLAGLAVPFLLKFVKPASDV